MTFIYDIPDYEHRGDLDWAEKELSRICNITNVHKIEERDYEAEADYASEYGEIDEYIYKGSIQFDASKEHEQALLDYGCYEY